ncbi:MAG: carbohydrate-binding protein [Negativicutes bacterium]|nr:carbohydrate-binding protein [Negativicutes bacterium]
MTQDKRSNSKYEDNGIVLSPAVPAKGETARVVYNGLLAQSGADKVYVHVGFGDDWKRPTDYRMNRSGSGFEAQIPVAIANTMNLCFKDNANNWDNNSGHNYSYTVL